jgi:NTE family protein
MTAARRQVSLALQGGGSHGAFTWGVLDRLLEDGRIDIEAISGASAGAMNAAALAHGYALGGRESAREALKDFWDAVASRMPFDLLPNDGADSAPVAPQSGSKSALSAFLSLTRLFSPYQLNPLDLNPLRDILDRQIDFARLRADSGIKLFIAATRVSTGTARLFRDSELTPDILLASACVPTFHHAIEIDGDHYWDGGLTANPPIFPLLNQCVTGDVVMVLLYPCRRPNTPTSAEDIRQRLTEISFTTPLLTELHALALAKAEAERPLFRAGPLERRLRRLNTHMIDSPELMNRLTALSKLNTHPDFLKTLYDEGRERTQSWLEDNFRHIGQRSSFSLGGFLQRETVATDPASGAKRARQGNPLSALWQWAPKRSIAPALRARVARRA